MRCLTGAFLLLCGVLLSSEAFAGGAVYLNGVRIDGVTNQKFDKVNVRIDELGNVFIDAPGYNVRQVQRTHEVQTQTHEVDDVVLGHS